jgi:hypothetical protein
MSLWHVCLSVDGALAELFGLCLVVRDLLTPAMRVQIKPTNRDDGLRHVEVSDELFDRVRALQQARRVRDRRGASRHDARLLVVV